MVPYNSAISDSLLIVDQLVEQTDRNVVEAYYQIKDIRNYQAITAENEQIERQLVIACDIPYLDLKMPNLDENYHQLARKSIKILYPKPEKLFATIIPLVSKKEIKYL